MILFTTWAGSTYAWNSPQIIGLGVACVLLLIAFVLVERKVAEPIIPPRLFRNVVFNIGTAVGLVIGLAMFGAIFFLPPFLQLVDEASPTNSGLRMVPLMIGLLASSIISGLLISRTGRYKIFPVLGTGLATFGMYLLSTLTPTTSVFALSLYMVIVGIGMGMVMQILVMAIQNAIDHKDMGVATSSATFFRSIGSCLGLAIFGSIFSNQLTSNLRAHLPASAHINPAALQGSPAALANLPAAVHGPVVQAFADSLHVVFLTAFPFLLVAFVLTWFLKEVPLRKHAGGLAAEGIELGEATGEIVVTAGEEDLAPEPSPVA